MSQIMTITTSSKDIAKAILAIKPVVEGHSPDAISGACLAIALLIQDPTLDMTKLIKAIGVISGNISLYLMEPEGTVS